MLAEAGAKPGRPEAHRDLRHSRRRNESTLPSRHCAACWPRPEQSPDRPGPSGSPPQQAGRIDQRCHRGTVQRAGRGRSKARSARRPVGISATAGGGMNQRCHRGIVQRAGRGRSKARSARRPVGIAAATGQAYGRCWGRDMVRRAGGCAGGRAEGYAQDERGSQGSEDGQSLHGSSDSAWCRSRSLALASFYERESKNRYESGTSACLFPTSLRTPKDAPKRTNTQATA